jgi:hypothetical protein
MATRTLRLSDDLSKRIADSAREKGFRSAAAFMRQAAENELCRHEAESASALAEKTAAAVARLADRLAAVERGLQGNIAQVDAFVKLFLVCVPEPAAPDRTKAQERHQKFIRAAAAGLNGNGEAKKAHG